MPKPMIYVETSVWSHAFAEDAPESRKATLEFLEAAKQERLELYVSEIVFVEFARSSENLAKRLYELVYQYNPVILDLDEDSGHLAQKYLN